MLEGIINNILCEPPRYILVQCWSLLEHSAWPRMGFALSSWYGDDAGGGSSGAGEVTVPDPAKITHQL